MQLQTVFDTEDETGFISRWFLKNRDKVLVDNVVFYLHYHITTALFFIGCLIVTVGMFIMDPIDCITDTAVDEVIDNYCLYHSTYTLTTGDYKESLVSHPGISATISRDAKFHNYYLWVALVLVLQGASFYIPRGIWKSWGQSAVADIIKQKDSVVFRSNETVINPNSKTDFHANQATDGKGRDEREILLSKTVQNDNMPPEKLRRRLLQCILSSKHRFYYWKLLFCEFLNLVNAFVQLLIMSKFLGFSLTEDNLWYNQNILELFHEARPFHKNQTVEQMFPKISACTFYTYGPSGSIVNYQAICVLPINAINEKIYAALYVWILLLIVVSGLAVLYRLVFLIRPFRNTMLKFYMREDELDSVTLKELNKLRMGNWQLLLQLAGNNNMDSWEFTQIVKGLCGEGILLANRKHM